MAQPIIPPDLRKKPRRSVNSDVMRHKEAAAVHGTAMVVADRDGATPLS